MHDNKYKNIYIHTYIHIGDIEFFKEQNNPPAILKRQDSVLPTSLNLNASFDDDGNEVSHGRSLTRQVSVLDPSLIMNTLFDDSGCIIEDIQSKLSENSNDPDYIATTNAILNTHLTSKESFIGRESRSSLLPTAIEASEIQLEVVDEFDEDLHFITALSFDGGPVVPVKRNSLLSFSTNII